MTTTLILNGESVEIFVMEGKDVHDDEAVLQVTRHDDAIITADSYGYRIDGREVVLDPAFAYAPLTNLQRALLVAPGHSAPKRGPLFNLMPES